jgi:hypothetical protein
MTSAASGLREGRRAPRNRITHAVIVIIVVLALVQLAAVGYKTAAYYLTLCRSYQLTKDYYGVKGFSEFCKRYEEISKNLNERGGVDAAIREDTYNCRYYDPRVTGRPLGFHGRVDGIETKPAGVTRILCIGSSTTERGYPEHLEALVNQKYPGRYQIINGGIPGARTNNLLMNYMLLWWRTLHPDVVIRCAWRCLAPPLVSL